MHTTKPQLKILLADDHALFRDGLRHILRQLDPDVILLETATHETAMAILAQHPEIDLALVDLHLKSRDGIELFEALLGGSQTVPVVVVSATEDSSLIRNVLAAGAMGFIPKSEAAGVMLGALRLVLSGGVYVPPMLVRSENRPRLGELTPRQQDVLHGMIQGRSNREIGDQLGLSEATVKVHVTAIFKCLNVSSRSQAAKLAEQRGMIRTAAFRTGTEPVASISAE